MKALLEEAVKFQPELYQLIRQRATLQELQQMQEQQLYIIQTKLREHIMMRQPLFTGCQHIITRMVGLDYANGCSKIGKYDIIKIL